MAKTNFNRRDYQETNIQQCIAIIAHRREQDGTVQVLEYEAGADPRLTAGVVLDWLRC